MHAMSLYAMSTIALEPEPVLIKPKKRPSKRSVEKTVETEPVSPVMSEPAPEPNMDIVEEKVYAISQCTKEKMEEQARYIETLSGENVENEVYDVLYVGWCFKNLKAKVEALSECVKEKIEQQTLCIKEIVEVGKVISDDHCWRLSHIRMELRNEYNETSKELSSKFRFDAISECIKDKIEEQTQCIETLGELYKVMEHTYSYENGESSFSETESHNELNEYFEDILTCDFDNRFLLEKRETNLELCTTVLSNLRRIRRVYLSEIAKVTFYSKYFR
jgi:hypothetical protein